MSTAHSSLHTLNKLNEPIVLRATQSPVAGLNDLQQPVGGPVPTTWTAPHDPATELSYNFTLSGQRVVLHKLHPQNHLDDLWEAFESLPDSFYTYLLFCSPFRSKAELAAQLTAWDEETNKLHFAVYTAPTTPGVPAVCLGSCCLVTISQPYGVVEVSNLSFPPQRLGGTSYAPDVISTLLRYVFGLSYRRVEWRCDALNIPSRSAALRYGFTCEGLFRHCAVYSDRRQRDTCWYGMLYHEWVGWVERAFVEYLDDHNFDENGTHQRKLADIMSALKEQHHQLLPPQNDVINVEMNSALCTQ